MTTYEPRPLDTSSVKLDDSLQALLERLAANTHDVWAIGRIADGWSYGPNRDDTAKTNPCLVPYEKLSEKEKGITISRTGEDALKAILMLGYRITAPVDKR